MRMLPLVLCLVAVQTAHAAVDVYEFKTTEQAARYQTLVEELRCLVCQNQDLADSNAGLAKDLRSEVAKQVNNGASEKQVVDFMVARYGDFVRYRPPFKAKTLLLWLGPFIMLLLGVIGTLMFVRRRSRLSVAELSGTERAQMSRLLHGQDEEART